MTTKKPQIANQIIERLKKAYSMKYDTEIAGFLGKDASTISTWRRRGTVDYAIIFTKCHDLNANFIIHGDMPIYRNEIIPPETANLISEPQKQYRVKDIIEQIEGLSIRPEEKMELLKIYLKILEERENN